MIMRHYSKIDLWIHLLIWGTILLSAIPIVLSESSDLMIMLTVFAPIIILMMVLLYQTYYIFEDDYLKVVVGGFPQKIYYTNIKSIRKTRNFLSSAALSADRIEIREKNKGFIRGTTYISPKNKDEFFEELRQHCPKDVEIY